MATGMVWLRLIKSSDLRTDDDDGVKMSSIYPNVCAVHRSNVRIIGAPETEYRSENVFAAEAIFVSRYTGVSRSLQILLLIYRVSGNVINIIVIFIMKTET